MSRQDKEIKQSNKIVVIVGTTASGKTGLGVKLAYEFNGEIISADSRQVYRGMNIGTGKDLAEYKIKLKTKVVNIPYHLIDVVDPQKKFGLAQFQSLTYEAINNIQQKNKLPIVVGGTGLYVQAIVDGYELPAVKPDEKLRRALEKMDIKKLYLKLVKLNPNFANRLTVSDKKNKRRLIRYIEIVSKKEKEEKNIFPSLNKEKKYRALLLGLTWPREILAERIYKRLIQRLEKENMIGEVEHLHAQGVNWDRLIGFGLEYKYITLYLQEKLDYDQMVERLFGAIKKFAKRQITWLRRWERQGVKIYWIKDEKEARQLVKKFLA
jgi:tRNA dimethylallyltransferase